MVIADTAGITLNSAPECTPDTANQVSCNEAAGNWQFLVVELKDMNDQLTVETMAPTFGGITVDGGDGDDHLDFTGLGGLDNIGATTGGRATVSASGGAGNDTLIGSQGGNVFDSSNRSDLPPDPNYDAGDDTLIGGPVADELSRRSGRRLHRRARRSGRDLRPRNRQPKRNRHGGRSGRHAPLRTGALLIQARDWPTSSKRGRVMRSVPTARRSFRRSSVRRAVRSATEPLR